MIITVASFKGGQAKTTTAVHLAGLFNERNPTLLVDGDPNRSATSLSKHRARQLAEVAQAAFTVLMPDDH